MSNPLLEKFDQPFGTIPFNEIKTDDFVSALDAAIEEAKSEIDAIANNPEDPTFDNTILAQELSGKKLGRVATTYFHLFGSDFQNNLFQNSNHLVQTLPSPPQICPVIN